MTEAEIIEGCVKQNVNCQRALFNQYAGRLMSVCLRYARDTFEAEDMLQESFITIFKAIHKFRFEGSFEGWVKKITVNTCLRKLRQKQVQFMEIFPGKSEEGFQPEIFSMLSEKEIISAISTLPEGYRIVFNLYVLDGYSHDEIAKLLSIKSVTSRSQLLKARKMLQKILLSKYKISSK